MRKPFNLEIQGNLKTNSLEIQGLFCLSSLETQGFLKSIHSIQPSCKRFPLYFLVFIYFSPAFIYPKGTFVHLFHINLSKVVHLFTFKLIGLQLIYELEDDGIGREKAQEILQKQNKDYKSLATTITQERIIVLN